MKVRMLVGLPGVTNSYGDTLAEGATVLLDDGDAQRLIRAGLASEEVISVQSTQQYKDRELLIEKSEDGVWLCISGVGCATTVPHEDLLDGLRKAGVIS